MNNLRYVKFKYLAVLGAGVSGIIGIGYCAHQPRSDFNWNPSTPTNIPESSSKWDFDWDKREPYSLVKHSRSRRAIKESEEDDLTKQLEKKKSKAVRHIILIRHGQYNLNGEGDSNRTLTELGHQQAKYTGERLKTLGLKFDKMIVSNMTRALQTAEEIKAILGQKEMEFCEPDPMLREGAPALPEPAVSHWHPDLHYYKDGARIEAAFRKYFHRANEDQEKDSFELVVCHANVIRYFVCRALQFPGEAWLRISLNHTSLTCLSILPSGRVILRALGDSGHLEPQMLTTS